MEALLRSLRLFSRTRGVLKLFSDKLRFYSLIWDILKDFEYIFKEMKAFVKKCEAFVRITRLLKDIVRRLL
jgi:hypothetical protein